MSVVLFSWVLMKLSLEKLVGTWRPSLSALILVKYINILVYEHIQWFFLLALLYNCFNYQDTYSLYELFLCLLYPKTFIDTLFAHCLACTVQNYFSFFHWRSAMLEFWVQLPPVTLSAGVCIIIPIRKLYGSYRSPFMKMVGRWLS